MTGRLLSLATAPARAALGLALDLAFGKAEPVEPYPPTSAPPQSGSVIYLSVDGRQVSADEFWESLRSAEPRCSDCPGGRGCCR